MSTRVRRGLLVLAGTLGLAACRCGAPTSVEAPPAPPAHSEAWLAGRLEPEPASPPKRGGTLTVRVAEEPAGLCPLHDRMQGRVAERFLMGPVYETLLTTDRAGMELRGGLAEGWTSDLTGAVQLFRLREGITFHDGTPLTAADVAATLKAVRSGMNFTTAARARLGPIHEVKVLDSRTVEVRWSSPSVSGVRALGLTIPILPAHALKDGFNTAAILNRPIGTGPFKVTGWSAGDALTLARHDGYWGAPAALEEVILRFVPDPEEAARGFEEGAYDVMTGLTPALWREMESAAWAHGYQRVRVIENHPQMLVWNQQHPALADARVRRALALLQPGAETLGALEQGLTRTSRCPFFPSLPACERDVAEAPDPAGAAALLREAGWSDSDGDGLLDKDGVPLLVRFSYGRGSEVSVRLAALLAPAWQSAGIRLEAQPMEWSELIEHLKARDFDAVAMAWPMGDPDAPLAPLAHSANPTGSNFGGHADPELDTLLERREAAFDPDARLALTEAVVARLEEDPPFLVVSFRPRLEAVKRRVRGWSDALAWPPLQQVWLERPTDETAHTQTGTLQ